MILIIVNKRYNVHALHRSVHALKHINHKVGFASVHLIWTQTMAKLKLRNMQQLLIYESYPICHLNSLIYIFCCRATKTLDTLTIKFACSFYILIRHR